MIIVKSTRLTGPVHLPYYETKVHFVAQSYEAAIAWITTQYRKYYEQEIKLAKWIKDNPEPPRNADTRWDGWNEKQQSLTSKWIKYSLEEVEGECG
jgi:hypothetical protein